METKQQNGRARSKVPHVILPVCHATFGQAVVDAISEMPWHGKVYFHFIFVVEVSGFPMLAPAVVPEVESDEMKYGLTLIKQLTESLHQRMPTAQVIGHIVTGVPQAEILKLADELQADMIVMGSHCRQGLRKVVLGSVAMAVTQDASCSTMIINLAGAEEPTTFAGPSAMTAEDLPAKMTTYATADEV